MGSTVSSVYEDRTLWEEFKGGDKNAFMKIYRENYPVLLKYGLKIKYHEEFVKDCIQETFLDLLNHTDTLGNTNNIRFYLLASLRRKIFRKLRYDLSFRIDENYYFDSLQQAESPIEESLIHEEQFQSKKNLLKDLIDHLTPRQREALLLKFYTCFDYTEIAKIMDMNVQSVRNLIYKAIKVLREQVREQFP
jgi:RNA polymerase sigma factor (sigma-70 family)